MTAPKDGGAAFLDNPDLRRLVNEYVSKGVRRPMPGANHSYDLAAHNIAAFVAREIRRRERARRDGGGE